MSAEQRQPADLATDHARELKPLHPRNRHRTGYDFPKLVGTFPALAPFVSRNAFGNLSIDFADPLAVKLLNQALLKTDYNNVSWDVPPGYLCPPIPGRADYLHYLADLLATDDDGTIPRGASVAILDLGTGANCIYPIIGSREYGWRFVGTEVDPIALRHARQIVAADKILSDLVDCRRQTNSAAIFRGVVKAGETFAASMCNPPFHVSAAAANAGTRRKLSNLGGQKSAELILNFGGQPSELWCHGGELAFIRQMILESAQMPQTCRWFTTLLSKNSHWPAIEHALANVPTVEVRIIPMAQGQKRSRIVAWTFLSPKLRRVGSRAIEKRAGV